MAITKAQELDRAVAFSIASGLRGAAKDKLAKELELNAMESRYDLIVRLTRMEQTPGLDATCFRLIPTGKAILRGDDSKRKAFDELVAWMNGMGPAPSDAKDWPN